VGLDCDFIMQRYCIPDGHVLLVGVVLPLVVREVHQPINDGVLLPLVVSEVHQASYRTRFTDENSSTLKGRCQPNADGGVG
jgi:hypothetical protein